ncbi:MAG TPA: T9SS type A sorting domain-containing protein [Bacteroidetes bacterium]|nr:T9SS type A sorting domain-containing protein [Bacteroidota bacterium]
MKIKDMDDLEGLQLAFNLDGLEFHDIKSSNLNISKNNYNIRQGKLLISVGEVTKDHIKSSGETTLFELSVIPQKSGRLSNMIALDTEVLHGELYRGNDLEINNISLDYRTSKNKFELYQNYPNPFNDQTTIRFSLKDSKEYIIEIFDINGKKIKTFSGIGKKGLNELMFDINCQSGIKLPHSSKNGISFYRLVSGNDSGIKKMLFINNNQK